MPGRRRDARVGTKLAEESGPGDRVAVNGVCLTATAIDDGGFSAEVMPRRCAAPRWQRSSGLEVNLELPLRAADRLGGHIVQGHVDGARGRPRVEPDGFAGS